MGKILNTYRGFTASNIISKASNTCTHTLAGQTVDCTDISVSKIKNVLGATTNNLSELCTNSNVNVYSGFSPKYWFVSGANPETATLTNDNKIPYQMGYFAGYNHNANASGWNGWKSSAETAIWVTNGGTATFIADVYISEIKYQDITNCLGFALTIWDGATLKGYDIIDINDTNVTDYCSFSCNVGNMIENKNYTGKIYLVNNISTFSQNLGNALCRIPNIDDFTTAVNIYVNSGLNTAGCAGWTVSGAGINLSNSTVSFSNMYSSNSYSDITIQVRLVKQFDGSSEITVYYSGAYNAYDSIGYISNVIHSSTPIPSYGYTAYLEVEVSS